MTDLDERFRRLLLMVPYVLRSQGVSVKEVCHKFGISKSQLIADLNLLFLCGLPGYGPGDLMEASIDGGQVSIRLADYFSRPLRLTPAEGLLLYSGARALAATEAPHPALKSAIERLKEVLGSDVLDRVTVAVDASTDVAKIRSAIESRRRLHLVYQSFSKDEVTQRDVDPRALFFSTGRWYLAGWCHKVADERIFRVDRMREVTVLEQAATLDDDPDASKYTEVYVEGPGALPVTIDLAPEARWVCEYYPLLSQEPLGDGWIRVQLTAGATVWLERLMLRLGPHGRVVAPDSLRRDVQDLACRLLARYR